MKRPNKALHRTAIPLRSIAAGELGRYADTGAYMVLCVIVHHRRPRTRPG